MLLESVLSCVSLLLVDWMSRFEISFMFQALISDSHSSLGGELYEYIHVLPPFLIVEVLSLLLALIHHCSLILLSPTQRTISDKGICPWGSAPSY